MNRELTLAMRMYADTARFVSGLQQGERGFDRFAESGKRAIDRVRSGLSSLEGKLAGIGVTVGLMQTAAASAALDKDIIRIGQTADLSADEVKKLRKEFFDMSKETGRGVDDLKQGFDLAVQSGLRFNEAVPVTEAVNKAMAVTNAKAESLTAALTVAGAAFEFDLSQPKMATDLLDKMTVAGRLGNAELENLSGIFARVAPNARAANFSFDKTLAFIEGLSKLERQPERLATLADSTLRLFTNQKYLQEAAEATGVRFFDNKGARRDPVQVLEDLRKQYRALRTDAQRADFMQSAFGKQDLDTQRGLKMLFTGDTLEQIRQFTGDIGHAAGTLNHDLQGSINNAVDQTGRLKAALREAADGFVKPINETFSNVIKWGMDKKENGGLQLDGKDMLLGGASLAALIYGGAKLGGKIFGKKGVGAIGTEFVGKLAGLGEGVAVGKALSTMGIQPVYVVNMPSGGMTGTPAGDLPGVPSGLKLPKGIGRTFGGWRAGLSMLFGAESLGAIGSMGAGAIATAGAGVAAAGYGGYQLGSYLYRHNAEAIQDALERIFRGGGYDPNSPSKKLPLDITVRVGTDGVPRVDLGATPPGSNVNFFPYRPLTSQE